MSDHESEVMPDGPDVESGLTDAFSANGKDPGAVAVATESSAGVWVDDGTTFLEDLARAMQSTASAEHARDAEVAGHRRQAHLDGIRAREALEAEELREYAKEDVKGIDEWSDGEIKRVKLERERRIASRREQLQIRLEEHRAVVAREVEAVEAAIATYRVETEQFFSRLESETDPVEIARQAGSRPKFPVLELIGPNDVPIAPIAQMTPVTSAYYSAPIAAVVTPEPVVEEDKNEPGADDGPSATSPLIGVMDPEASASPVEAPWEPDAEVISEPVISEPVTAEPVTSETLIGEEAEVPVKVEVPVGAGEPVAAVSEARVVVPKSSGAGSWLRWPSNSVDRPDSGR